MTRHTILFVALFALLLFVAIDAQAVDTTKYPATLVDQTCTDAKDTVTGQGAFSTFVQDTTGGGADGLCDHDKRILTGAITSDTTFGPFVGGPIMPCWYVFFEVTASTGGDTNWHPVVGVKGPHDGVVREIHSGADVSPVTGDHIITLGSSAQHNPSGDEYQLNAQIAREWYLILDLDTATSWTGEISMVGCG
jgi:hypothetical protein